MLAQCLSHKAKSVTGSKLQRKLCPQNLILCGNALLFLTNFSRIWQPPSRQAAKVKLGRPQHVHKSSPGSKTISMFLALGEVADGATTISNSTKHSGNMNRLHGAPGERDCVTGPQRRVTLDSTSMGKSICFRDIMAGLAQLGHAKKSLHSCRVTSSAELHPTVSCC